MLNALNTLHFISLKMRISQPKSNHIQSNSIFRANLLCPIFKN